MMRMEILLTSNMYVSLLIRLIVNTTRYCLWYLINPSNQFPVLYLNIKQLCSKMLEGASDPLGAYINITKSFSGVQSPLPPWTYSRLTTKHSLNS